MEAESIQMDNMQTSTAQGFDVKGLQAELNHVNEHIKPKSVWGRIFTHWSQIPNAIGFGAGTAIGVYGVIKKNDFAAILGFIVSGTNLFLHFVIPCLVPRRKLEDTMNKVIEQGQALVEKGNQVIEDNKKNKEEIDTFTKKEEEFYEQVKVLENVNKEIVNERTLLLKEKEETAKDLENKTKDIVKLAGDLKTISQEKEKLEKVYTDVKNLGNKMALQLKQFNSSNTKLEDNVTKLDNEAKLIEENNNEIGINLNEFKNQTQQFDKENNELIENMKLIQNKIEELHGAVKQLTEERIEREKKQSEFKKDNENFESTTKLLEVLVKIIQEKKNELETLSKNVDKLATLKLELRNEIQLYIDEKNKDSNAQEKIEIPQTNEGNTPKIDEKNKVSPVQEKTEIPQTNEENTPKIDEKIKVSKVKKKDNLLKASILNNYNKNANESLKTTEDSTHDEAEEGDSLEDK
jgi:hypothetical protein